MLKKNVFKAYEFSKMKHEGQVRKFTDLPYFSHPKEVARIIEQLTKDETLVIVALLHDTIEDTSATYNDIEIKFGKVVADLVMEVTSYKPREMSKAIYLGTKMSGMSIEALVVKLADRFHNVKYLEGDGVPLKFVKKYYHETWTILHMIKESEHMNKVHPLNNVRDLLIERIEVILKFLEVRYDFS